MLQGYETKPAEGKKFEAHRRYVDIQYVVSGAERIGHAHTAGLRVVQPYDPETDCALYDPPAGTGTDLVLCAGAFAIFWPHDAHRPGCALGAPAPVRKVVLKVEL
jgi:YhcH/YjgK/YiaL family protein